MNILVLACLSHATGNNSTAERIRNHLSSVGINATLKCANTNEEELKQFIKRNNIVAIIGIHAYRAGKFLKDCNAPYLIVFGGTDLNEHYKNPKKLMVMSSVIENARFCIAFSESLKSRAISLWPCSEDKIIIQAQAICPNPSRFTIKEDLSFLKSDHEDILNNNVIIFLLVAGLRPVKDPLFLANVISAWHEIDKRIHLVIIGPKLDEEFSQLCRKEISRLSGVVLLDPMGAGSLNGFMEQAFALVNSSKSEGMANSILEAMRLGTLVFARRNEGNQSIIKHRQNGFLFDSPQEFIQLAEEMISSNNLKKEIIENAKHYISEFHSIEEEREKYVHLAKILMKE